MYFDGLLMKTGAREGLIFISPLGIHMRYMIRIHVPASNNVGKYKVLVNGLHIAAELWIQWLDVRGNSRLVVDQVMKESSCHDPRIAAYYRAVRLLQDKFDGLELNHVARRFNEAADGLMKLASSWEPFPSGVFASDLHKPQ
jgi:ribonuclease HI